MFISRKQELGRSTYRQTLAAKEDVGHTRVLHLRQASLFVIIERDVPHISLDLFQSDRNSVSVIIGNGVIWGKLEEVVRLALNNAREEIAALQSEILNDEIKRFVRVLDAGNGNISNLLDQSGKDDFTNVFPEFGLEFERTLAIEE